MFHVEQGTPEEGSLMVVPDNPVPSRDFLEGLITGAGLSVPTGAVEKLVSHAREVIRWNRSIRLTAITSPEEIAVKHILDSLLLLAFSPFPGRILDFGSGAGYPGIPLAIALPGSRIILLESSGKKCAFLSHARRMLSLPNAEVVQGRLSERTPPAAIGRFEHIVTRATLPQDEAVPLLTPYLGPGGRMLLMRGPGKKDGERIGEKGPSRRGDATVRSVRFTLPLGMGSREIREIVPP